MRYAAEPPELWPAPLDSPAKLRPPNPYRGHRNYRVSLGLAKQGF